MAVRTPPPMVIIFDLLIIFICILIINNQQDSYEIYFEDQAPPFGSKILFKDMEGGRYEFAEGSWNKADAATLRGAVYISCGFCGASVLQPPNIDGNFEIALVGDTSRSLKDLFFEECAAKRKCRPLQVSVSSDGTVILRRK